MEKNIKELIEERQRQHKKRIELTEKIIRQCYESESGKYFIRWLTVESRFFADGLRTISSLRSKYNMPSEYYTGQTDLIKKILGFMTAEQVADLTAAVVKKAETEKKEEENGRE